MGSSHLYLFGLITALLIQKSIKQLTVRAYTVLELTPAATKFLIAACWVSSHLAHRRPYIRRRTSKASTQKLMILKIPQLKIQTSVEICSSLSYNFLHDRSGQPETIFRSPTSGSNFCISHVDYSSQTLGTVATLLTAWENSSRAFS